MPEYSLQRYKLEIGFHEDTTGGCTNEMTSWALYVNRRYIVLLFILFFEKYFFVLFIYSARNHNHLSIKCSHICFYIAQNVKIIYFTQHKLNTDGVTTIRLIYILNLGNVVWVVYKKKYAHESAKPRACQGKSAGMPR